MNAIRKSTGLLIVMMVLLLFTACASKSSAPIVINTFEDARTIFKEIRNAPAADAQKRADELWQTLVDNKRVPLVLGTQVIFLYKGDAQQVSWTGSFNYGSNRGLVGVRLGQTDLWVAYMDVPPASRMEYKIVLNGTDWIVDPVNPNKTFSGITGEMNVLTAPGFTVTDERKTRTDIEHGTLTENLSIESKALGYTVDYWVYTPAGYDNLSQLPVIYALDGNDFKDERMGALPNLLNAMIADEKIRPLIAVFIDAREPGNPQHNRREEEFLAHPVEHASFIADELVAEIDRAYRTNPQPDARLIIGVSYGGLSASFIAASRSDVFHNIAAFSPTSAGVTDPKMIEGLQTMAPIMNTVTECGLATEFQCPRFPLKIFFSWGIPAWDVGDLSSTIADLQRTHYPVVYYQVQEGHSWDNWRGLSDEMLIHFFGTD